jgi:hypothetical protein
MHLANGPSCSLGLFVLVVSLGPACSGGDSSGGAQSGSSSGTAVSGSSGTAPGGSSSSGSTSRSSSGGGYDAAGTSSSSGGPGDDAAGASSGSDATADVGSSVGPEGGGLGFDGSFPTTTDGGPAPSYSGEIPQYPDVGPTVMMDCPGDPTMGYTEYKDTFHVESPYTLPTNNRFSITNGGIYNFWVFPNDSAHSPTANGKSPRSEARWGQLVDAATGGNFTTGQRIWSGDAFWESSVTGSIIFQVHTTATGIGPVYMNMTGTSISDTPPISGGTTIMGGSLAGRWVNMKVAFDAATRSSQVYINNCLMGTITNGTGGDGHFYFKNGVYHCGAAAGCRDHYKNIHFYKK